MNQKTFYEIKKIVGRTRRHFMILKKGSMRKQKTSYKIKKVVLRIRRHFMK